MKNIPGDKKKNISVKKVESAYQSQYSNIPSTSTEQELKNPSTLVSSVVLLKIRKKHKIYETNKIEA